VILSLKKADKEEDKEDEAFIDLESASPSDIVQIGSLLESKQEGIQALSNSNSLLTSGGLDNLTFLPVKHTWKLLSSNKDGGI
jgi:hypothetical protein